MEPQSTPTDREISLGVTADLLAPVNEHRILEVEEARIGRVPERMPDVGVPRNILQCHLFARSTYEQRNLAGRRRIERSEPRLDAWQCVAQRPQAVPAVPKS